MRQRNPGQRAAVTRGQRRVCGARLFERDICGHADIAVQRRIVSLDARQVIPRNLLAGEFAGIESTANFDDACDAHSITLGTR